MNNQILNMKQELEKRVTFEVLDETMRKLDQYVMLKSFQNLQRIVSTKTDDIAFDELRI